MRTILLVDDEIICRLGIKALLDWEVYGYQIIGEVSNGEEALLFMKTHLVDLVITDIKMTIMSGIELITQIRKNYPHTETVVVSAYDDYEFVRKALKQGAIDYILKLNLNVEVMINLIERVNEKLNKKQAKRVEDTELFSSDINKNYQRQLMRDLLYGRKKYSEIKEILKENQIELRLEYIGVVEFSLGTEFSGADRGVVFSLLEEILLDYEKSYICMSTDNTMCIVYNTDLETEELRKKCLDSMVNRMIALLRNHMHLDIRIYISNISDDSDHLANLFLQISEIKAMMDLHDEGEKLYYQDIYDCYSKRDTHVFDTYVKRLREIQAHNEADNLYGLISEIYNYFREEHYVNVSDTRHFMMEICSIVNWMCWKCTGKLLKEFTGEKLEFIEDMNHMQDIYSYMERILDILDKIKKSEEDSYLVRKVKKYIDDHYTQRVQISVLAESMYMSNSYLSTLFKKETGGTIKDYLINKRVLEAKKLLKDSGMQIQEVSRSVGCDNEHYFSTMFKQRTGKSPKEYRSTKTIEDSSEKRRLN